MEEKLREFRARRRRQELIDEAKDKLQKFLTAGVREEQKMEQTKLAEREPFLPAPASAPSATFLSGRRNVELAADEEAWEAEDDEHSRAGIISGRIKRGMTVLLAVLWLTIFLVSYQLELAMAYCLISAIFFVYMCTRTRPRKPNEPSAYSVFNPNCQSIDGSLTAEQFEREIRGGPASVR